MEALLRFVSWSIKKQSQAMLIDDRTLMVYHINRFNFWTLVAKTSDCFVANKMSQMKTEQTTLRENKSFLAKYFLKKEKLLKRKIIHFID